MNKNINKYASLSLLSFLLLACGLKEDVNNSTKASAVGQKIDRAAFQYWKCSTYVYQGRHAWTYYTQPFNNASPWAFVTVSRDGEAVEQLALRKLTTRRWQNSKKKMTLNLEFMNGKADMGIRVFHHSIGKTAPITQACAMEDHSLDQCEVGSALHLDSDGYYCLQTGIANESIVGNMLIEVLGDSVSLGLIKLITKGIKKGTLKLFRAGPRHAVVMSGGDAPSIGRWQAITSGPIQRSLDTIDEKLLDALLDLAKKWDGQFSATPRATPVSPNGWEYFNVREHNAYYTLGTLREFTRITGREIAAVRTGGKSILEIASKSTPWKIGLSGGKPGSSYRLLFHTQAANEYERALSKIDEFNAAAQAAMPSQGDMDTLLVFGQQVSFIIPPFGQNFLVKFWTH